MSAAFAPQAATLPLLEELLRIVERGPAELQAQSLGEVEAAGSRWPLLAVSLGNPDPSLPAVVYVGGVHGLERIGAEVVLAYLGSLVMRMAWDGLLRALLERQRLVFMPLVNPAGLWLGTRANPQGIDLMRNAPLDAEEPAAFMVGGQRISAGLPWYRGESGAPMAPESQALCELVERESRDRLFTLALDCHSGFGLSDRIWFPYAGSSRPMPHLAEVHALVELMDRCQAQHPYVVEPQSRQYLAHGDLWDHLYRHACSRSSGLLLPLTLEMGSWLWIKKNPRQLLTRHGIFNPLIAHRQQRVLRRHMAWLDFMGRVACSAAHWLPRGEDRRPHEQAALARWFRRTGA